MPDQPEVIQNYQQIMHRITAAAKEVGRDPATIRLVAVSKKQDVTLIQTLIDYLNQQGETPILGESYVQEWRQKKPLLRGNFQTHCIGALQSNKVREALPLFDVLEAVASGKNATLVNKESERLGQVTEVFLQVNVSGDPNKQGFTPAAVRQFAEVEASNLAALRIRGLMTIPRQYENKELVRADYAALRLLREELANLLAYRGLERQEGASKLELSMGMSDDFEIAIAEGATLVRIGTALFGERS